MPALPVQHTAEKDAPLVCRVHWWQASKQVGGGGGAGSQRLGAGERKWAKALVLYLYSPLGTILGQQCH